MHPLYAGLIGSSLLSATVLAAAAAQAAPERTVQAQMRNVAFHVDSTTVLSIHYARGALRRTAPEHPAYLDDKHSFVLDLDTARIGISPAALSQVLNRYTFNYPGSPLRKLAITIDHGRLRQQGRMRGISFDVVGELSLTDNGELRLHPTTIKAVGIKVGGLMKFFGLSLEKLVDTERARGVRIDRERHSIDVTRTAYIGDSAADLECAREVAQCWLVANAMVGSDWPHRTTGAFGAGVAELIDVLLQDA